MRRWSYKREGPAVTTVFWTSQTRPALRGPDHLASVVVGGPSCGQRKDGDEFVTEFVDDKDENRDGTRDGRDGVD
jgi:hypothetical protein